MENNHDTSSDKKPVTLDDLADMVANGFTETDKKIQELERQIDLKLDLKISPLPTKSYIDEKFANLEGDLTADGKAYDLLTNLENTSDPDRCAVKIWKSAAVWAGEPGCWSSGVQPRSAQIYSVK